MGPGIWRGLPVHWLPGRLRIRLPAPGDAGAAQRVRELPGVTSATHNPCTGSLLIRYDPGRTDLEQIAAALGLGQGPPVAVRPDQASAAPPPDQASAAPPPDQASAAPPPDQASAAPPPDQGRKQLLLTGGALAAVAAKRLLLGPSALSRSWGSYDLAGIITVAASYPFLRSGVHAALTGRGLSADLLIGTVGLAATVMRENLWGLSVLFLTSLTHWLFARTRAECPGQPRTGHAEQLAREAAAAAHRWGRLSVGAAALTGLLTGNWRRALATLIAAAPAATALSATLPLCAAAAAGAREGAPARRAVATARRSQAISTLMNFAGLCLAAGGLIGPLGASLWHNITSLLVVAGAFRLLV